MTKVLRRTTNQFMAFHEIFRHAEAASKNNSVAKCKRSKLRTTPQSNSSGETVQSIESWILIVRIVCAEFAIVSKVSIICQTKHWIERKRAEKFGKSAWDALEKSILLMTFRAVDVWFHRDPLTSRKCSFCRVTFEKMCVRILIIRFLLFQT